MPYTTVVAGTAITASWSNANNRDQTIVPFLTTVARDAAITAPVIGQVCYLKTNDAAEGLSTYTAASVWRPPWNQPWGRLNEVLRTTDILTLGGNSDLPSMSMTVTPAAGNRRIKLWWMVYGGNQAGAGLCEIHCQKDGVDLHKTIISRAAGNTPYGFYGSVVDVGPTVAAHTYKLSQAVSGGTPTMDYFGGVTYPITLQAEDIGPSGQPV